ncbi:BRF1 protein [Loa loa]|uniref:B-related factor 1 n=1 Tax=Loa loa TaxID=7209 RepID=A0A1I7VBL3_LOALO|nr:BRF1 protein [Loa loa]EFO21323.2 BRF1 protein [Loa loa]
MSRKCPNCGSSEIDDDAARGDSTCMGCGTVLEESTIVSDVAFQENAGGGHSLVGQFISKERGQPTNLSGVPGLSHQESREITYYKGRKLIEEIASQLRINQHCVNTAFNFFKMCVSRNFTRGRVRSHVVAACLYMTCRLENTAHLLLDFSDITQVNVFDLGRTLNFLTRSLKINLPTTDPCMYILRFAVSLDFGTKQKEVVSLATRLVQRMKRDWIATGRRPTGLCGAALLLAARCYNFNRTVADVVRVVHISEAVVKKRLDEFGQTPSSTLTIDEFTSVDLEHCEDPPAFRESRRKARELQLQKEEEALRKIELEMSPMEAEVERALEKRRKERFKRTQYAQMMSGSLGSESDELTPADAVVRNEIVDLVFSAARSTTPLSDAGMSSTYAPSLVSLGITPIKNEVEPIIETSSEKLNSNEELDLEGIDDEEIDTYILTEEEVDLKTRFWMKLNGEHLKEMERRRREREEEEREKDNSIKKRRRTNGIRKKEPIVAATAQEAMEKVIHEKKLSNKINYDILREIEDADETVIRPEMDCSTSDVKEETSETSEHTLFKDSRNLTLTTRKTLKTRRRFRPNVNLATKKAVEQTISVIAASNAAKKNASQEEKESTKGLSMADEERTPFVGEVKTNERGYTGAQYRVTSDVGSAITEAGISSTSVEHCSPSVSLPKTDRVDSSQAGTSHSTAEFMGKVGRFTRKRPAKLTVGESSELINFNSKNAAVTEIPSGKPRMAKARYAKMQPNLKSVQKTDKSVEQNCQKSSLAVAFEVPGENNIEDEGRQQRKGDTEIPSTPGNSKMEVVSPEGVSKESPAQNTSEMHSTKTKTTGVVATGKTRSRYLRVKPNLLKRSETQASEKS